MKFVFRAHIMLFSILSTVTHAQLPTGENASVRPDKVPDVEVIFFDDFSGQELNRSIWNVEVTQRQTVNNEQQAYVDSNEVLYLVDGRESEGAENGALVIQARFNQEHFIKEQDRKCDFISGRINTQGRMEFAYGTASARMKLPLGSGLWPAFWALGSGQWPETGEIDIMEYVGYPGWTSVALHGPGYSGETPLVNKYFFRQPSDATAWHVYSVDWSPDGFVFRVDDQVIYCATRAMIEHYGPWEFANKKFLILNLAIGGAYPEKTNGVQSPYPGLPEETVERIKAGEAKVMVDWVRVTKNKLQTR